MSSFRSKSNRRVLSDSEISGLIRIARDGGLTYVVSDRFYIVDNGVKKPMGSVSELLSFLRGCNE